MIAQDFAEDEYTINIIINNGCRNYVYGSKSKPNAGISEFDLVEQFIADKSLGSRYFSLDTIRDPEHHKS